MEKVKANANNSEAKKYEALHIGDWKFFFFLSWCVVLGSLIELEMEGIKER